jgi:inner membrane protein
MASIISHPVVPLAIGLGFSSGVVSRKLLIAGVICSMAPDLDVYLHRAADAYSAFEHRGLTHSSLFAAMCGAIAAACAKRLDTRPLIAFVFISIAMASHGFLDAFTTGGPGILFFWPFSEERYFMPLQFIQVSPLGIRPFFSSQGLSVLWSELKWLWLPGVVLAIALHWARSAALALKKQ